MSSHGPALSSSGAANQRAPEELSGCCVHRGYSGQVRRKHEVTGSPLRRRTEEAIGSGYRLHRLRCHGSTAATVRWAWSGLLVGNAPTLCVLLEALRALENRGGCAIISIRSYNISLEPTATAH